MHILITGGNSGIGFEATRHFLTEPTTQIIWGCRNKEKADAAKLTLPSHQQSRVTILKLDLSDLESVRSFADSFKSLNVPLNVLILNAGVMSQSDRKAFPNGMESTLMSNHFGHFLLTFLVLPFLTKSAGRDGKGKSQIIVVASTLHDNKVMPGGKFKHVDWDNLDGSKEFDGMLFYRYSKLFNVWFSYALARRLGPDPPVLVNAVCPGFIPATGLSRESSKVAQFFMKYVLSIFPFTRSLSHGAESYVLLASNKESWHGKFISDKKVTRSSDDSYLESEQEHLWNLSERITGVKFEI